MLKLVPTPETQPEQPDVDAADAILGQVATDGAEPEEADAVSRIVDHLRERETYSEASIMREFKLTGGPGRRTIWAALQVMRAAHAIEFVPGDAPGVFQRATAEQCLRRGRSFGRAIRRKKARQVAIYEAAATVTTDADLRRRLESAAAKASDEHMALEAFAARARKPRPDGI